MRGCEGSAGRRERVVAVAVTLADLPVLALDECHDVLVASDVAGPLEGLPLGMEHGGQAFVAFAPDTPLAAMSDDLLVLTTYIMYIIEKLKPIYTMKSP